MNITKDTKLLALLEEYPFLKEKAMQISDKFSLLDTPMGKIFLRYASIGDLAKKANLSEKKVLDKIQELIDAHTQ